MKLKTQVQAIEIGKSKREQSQTQKICFEVRAPSSTSPPSPHEEFLHPQRKFHKGTSTEEQQKELPQRNNKRSTQDLEYTTPTFNPLYKR